MLSSYAQIIPPEGDTIPKVAPDFKPGKNPSSRPPSSPATQGTGPAVNLSQVKVSNDALDAKVTYNSRDSMWLDAKNETVYLYGDAVVKYNELTVTADYIVFNMADNIVLAEGVIDSSGQLSGFPVFEEKDQKFDSKKLRYNFETNKGIIYDAVTTQQDLYIRSGKGGFFGKDSLVNRKTDVIYSEDAIFTTCSHPEPHFGIRSRKQKVIPNEVVVVGPSNIEVGGIPTPLWLPFAFFPLKQGPRTGMIFPRDYEYSDAWGFGLKDLGWYFPMNDYWDLTIKGMVYTRGTWGADASIKYAKRYKYTGNFTVGYSSRKKEQLAQTLTDQSVKILWSHAQDAKAHPTRRLSGSVNIQTNNYQSLNENEADKVLQNTLTSSINYSQSFPGKPYSINMSMNHSQNTLTRRMDITLPSFNFNMNRVYPFKRKNSLDNKDKWFEKIGVQYQSVAQNRFTTTDTTLFSRQTLEDARFGIKHTANANASFRIFKHFNFTPSIDYNETWYFDRTQKELLEVYEVDSIFTQDGALEFFERLDTTQYGEIADLREFGFTPLRTFNTGVSLSTQIFGVRTFTKGKLMGIRHVIKPSVSFNYSPDYTDPGFGYFDFVDSDLREEFNEPQRYSIFEEGIYGGPSTSGKQMTLGYSLNNIFEAKYWSDRDSTAKNLKLFDNIYTNGNYNFAADSLNWSPIQITGTTRFFNGITTFNAGATFDPYAIDENGDRINTFHRATGGGVVRYVRANMRFNTGVSVKQIRALFTKGKRPTKSALNKKSSTNTDSNTNFPDNREDGDQRPVFEGSAAEEGLLELFESWRISHQMTFESTPDTFFMRTHSIQTSGSIKLTEKWSMRFGNISYDFKLKRLVYPTLGFRRDLHCWEMGMDWYPERGTFSFYLRVKPGSLDFIKVPYGRNNADSFGGF